MKKLNITFCSTPDYSGNAKALYEYMVKRYKNHMNFVWIAKSEIMYKKLLEKNVRVYLLGSDAYLNYIKKTDVFFTTHANITNDKPKGSLYIELWHGISSKPVGFLVKNIKPNDEQWFHQIKRKIDYIIVPSSFWIPIFSARFNINSHRILDLGYPKLNYLVNSNGKKNLEKIVKTNILLYNKIIFYFPTYSKGCGWKLSKEINSTNLINLKKYEEKLLEQYLVKNNYLLCIGHHPEDEINYQKYESKNIKVMDTNDFYENELTTEQILNIADLLITDYSSLGLEYLFLEKPVIYVDTDIEEYKKIRGFMFNDFDFWSPGYKVNTIKDLIREINRAFHDNKNEEILKKKRLFFGDLKDGNCKKICDYFFEKNSIKSNIIYYNDKEEILEEEIIKTKEAIDNLKVKSEELSKENDDLQAELNDILNSKGWKIIKKIRNIKNKILRRK